MMNMNFMRKADDKNPYRVKATKFDKDCLAGTDFYTVEFILDYGRVTLYFNSPEEMYSLNIQFGAAILKCVEKKEEVQA